MTGPSGQIELSELQQALSVFLAASHPSNGSLVRLVREPSAYYSSFPLEVLTAWFEDGNSLKLMFKNLNPRALSTEARAAKPVFLDDPRREIAIYRHVLDPSRWETAACYGSVVDEATDRYWLFLEKVEGRELYQVGEFEIWRQAARWLAGFHAAFAPTINVSPPAAARLIRYNAEYAAQWIERALAFEAQAAAPAHLRRVDRMKKIADCYLSVIDELLSLPVSLIHGEFYASNVLVQSLPGKHRVCPIDWERTALGPGLVDLAALTAGSWQEDQRLDLALTYHSELVARQAAVLEWAALVRGLNVCRLFLAVQWLGWSPTWTPPSAQRHDWLSDAEYSARRLGYLADDVA